MSHFPSIPNLDLLGLFLKFLDRGILPLLEPHDAILRNDSELTVGERELIAAHVSSLNDCHFFGGVRVDLDHAGVPGRMKPVRGFVRLSTRNPAGTGAPDAQAVQEAGFSEEGSFDVISVSALDEGSASGGIAS